jgi:hypothetical protein
MASAARDLAARMEKEDPIVHAVATIEGVAAGSLGRDPLLKLS